jgi:glycosyltransferase involved in cell wall biosynthesis
MNGIQVWSPSYCRSTFGFYEALANYYRVPLRVCTLDSKPQSRAGLGWSADEFKHVEVVLLADDLGNAFKQLEAYADWHQLFGVYQRCPVIQKVLARASTQGIPVGVGSEAPLNMFAPGLKRCLKQVFVKYVLPARLKPFIKASDFILNYSGDYAEPLLALGWPAEKIIPAGYYSPPLEQSSLNPRGLGHHRDFHILCTGVQTWHRGQAALIEAAILLKRWGLSFRITITQDGPLKDQLAKQAADHGLPISFVGRVPISELRDLLSNCSVYVATGRAEPWGIRVNDALHCGVPLVVSSGMGAAKVVNEHGCGLIYEAGDSVDLAWKLRSLIQEQDRFVRIANNVAVASDEYRPDAAAERIGKALNATFPNWKAHNE